MVSYFCHPLAEFNAVAYIIQRNKYDHKSRSLVLPKFCLPSKTIQYNFVTILCSIYALLPLYRLKHFKGLQFPQSGKNILFIYPHFNIQSEDWWLDLKCIQCRSWFMTGWYTGSSPVQCCPSGYSEYCCQWLSLVK